MAFHNNLGGKNVTTDDLNAWKEKQAWKKSYSWVYKHR